MRTTSAAVALLPLARGVLDFSAPEYDPGAAFRPVGTIENHWMPTHLHPGQPLVLEARAGKLWAGREGEGTPNHHFHIKGVNWYGSEDRTGAPGGIDYHSIDYYMGFLAQHGFNAIRLLFNHESVLRNGPIESHDISMSPQLFNMSYLDMFAEVANAAAKRNILVVMGCHRLSPKAWPGNGLWYDNIVGVTEARVLESWDRIATRLCGAWNVFAADLQNEPHSSSWGRGLAEKDWNKAAERIGNHVLSKCERWLIMVEGVGSDPGAMELENSHYGIWWGENLAGVAHAPVTLSTMTRLVYSPHVYGPSVYKQGYFSDRHFPKNMGKIWDRHFASAIKATGQPIVFGEMGGWYTGDDKTWQDWAFERMTNESYGVFYFALNPDSEDTGGLLWKDWSTPNWEKLHALETIRTTDVKQFQQAVAPSPPPPTSPTPPPSPLPSAPSSSC